MALRDRLHPVATAIPAIPAIPAAERYAEPPRIAAIATIATPEPPCGYSKGDLAELRRLARRWHELTWPDQEATEKTLSLLKRIASVNVMRELHDFRRLVTDAGAAQ